MTDHTSDLQVFANGEFELAVQDAPDGSIHVLAPGLARALGYREARDMLRPLPEDQKGSALARTSGGDQRVSWVTEAAAYRLIGQRRPADIPDEAKRAAAERFQTWVFADVLPAIRRQGYYATPETAAYLDAVRAVGADAWALLSAAQGVTGSQELPALRRLRDGLWRTFERVRADPDVKQAINDEVFARRDKALPPG